MNRLSFTAKLSDIKKTTWLGCRPATCHFSNNELPNFKELYGRKGIQELGRYVSSLRSGEYIPKSYYSETPTQYIYLTVGNCSQGQLDLMEITFLDSDIGEQKKGIQVSEGDIIITRSGTVGVVSVFSVPVEYKDYIFIPSHHLAVLQVSSSEDVVFLKYFLNYPFCKRFFAAYATGKVQKEITNWSVKKIPIPACLNRDLLSREFQVIDKRITLLASKLLTLQDIIDEVFINHKLITAGDGVFRTFHLIVNSANIGMRKAARIGAEYNDFWLSHKGLLFEDKNNEFDILPLKRLIKIGGNGRVKKGTLDSPRILIDFGQINALKGTIDRTNIVTEIGSDKVAFGTCDFVTNKLDPYSGYTFLNEPDLDMIGSSELWPLDLRNSQISDVHYLRYLLLSTEYLQKSKLIMSGKRHPRLHISDFLDIRVPHPPIGVQKSIVKQISMREKKAQQLREEILCLRQSGNTIITKALSQT